MSRYRQDNDPAQPSLFDVPEHNKLAMQATGPSFASGKHCLSRLGQVIGRRLQLNMADSGRYIEGNTRRDEQARLLQAGEDSNFADFEKAREMAKRTYKRLGNAAMCGECLGASACPIRAMQPTTGERIVNGKKSLSQYAADLPQSARDNIKRAKVTPRTIAASRIALHRQKY